MLASPQIHELQQRIALSVNQSTYKELFAQFYKSLPQFAATFISSPEAAEEIVSDVFIKGWNKRTGLNRIHNLKLYLFISTRNGAFNCIRTPKKIFLQQYFVQLQSLYFNPEKLMITAEMMNRVQKVINDLPPRCLLNIKLIKEDGRKYREVADLLHRSLKSVENQMEETIRQPNSTINQKRSRKTLMIVSIAATVLMVASINRITNLLFE